MNLFKVLIKPLSPFATPWQSDTIFGHLCWIIRMKEGEGALLELLERFSNGNPPFILSSVLPDGYLPTPVLPPLNDRKRTELHNWLNNNEFKTSPITMSEALGLIKAAQRVKFIRIEDFKSELINNLSTKNLIQKLIEKRNDETAAMSDRLIMRTAVDRISSSGLEGQLFDHKEYYFQIGGRNKDKQEEITLAIWVKIVEADYKPKLEEWLTELQRQGFGADVSTGSGQFEFVRNKETKAILHASDDEFPAIDSREANAFITLSAYVPAADDPNDGYYSYRVKRGKLGSIYSLTGIDSDDPRPWKQPLIMFEPGSLFKLNGAPLQPRYGRMVDNIHRNSEKNIYQYGFAFPLGVKVEDA